MPNVSASLLVQRGTGARTLHLVNHNYKQGNVPQSGFSVEVDLRSCPRRVTTVSPDFAGSKVPESSCRHGKLQVMIDRLDCYDVHRTPGRVVDFARPNRPATVELQPARPPVDERADRPVRRRRGIVQSTREPT